MVDVSLGRRFLKLVYGLLPKSKRLKTVFSSSGYMAVAQHRSKRKASGGRYVAWRTKRLYELARSPTLTQVGKRVTKVLRGLGGRTRSITVMDATVNLFDPKTKKYSQEKIEAVVENPANRHYVRRNIMTKGTIVKTGKGNARVVSRPGQEGVINAVLVKA